MIVTYIIVARPCKLGLAGSYQHYANGDMVKFFTTLLAGTVLDLN